VTIASADRRLSGLIASQNRTVVAHIAEPDSCRAPLNPSSPDYQFCKAHPGEYAFAHPEWPSKAAILAARAGPPQDFSHERGALVSGDNGHEINPNFEVARLDGKKPLTRLATLATLSPRERAVGDAGSQPSPLGRGWLAAGAFISRSGPGEGSLPENLDTRSVLQGVNPSDSASASWSGRA